MIIPHLVKSETENYHTEPKICMSRSWVELRIHFRLTTGSSLFLADNKAVELSRQTISPQHKTKPLLTHPMLLGSQNLLSLRHVALDYAQFGCVLALPPLQHMHRLTNWALQRNRRYRSPSRCRTSRAAPWSSPGRRPTTATRPSTATSSSTRWPKVRPRRTA